jgi:hypothetical protein
MLIQLSSIDFYKERLNESLLAFMSLKDLMRDAITICTIDKIRNIALMILSA